MINTGNIEEKNEVQMEVVAVWESYGTHETPAWIGESRNPGVITTKNYTPQHLARAPR